MSILSNVRLVILLFVASLFLFEASELVVTDRDIYFEKEIQINPQASSFLYALYFDDLEPTFFLTLDTDEYRTSDSKLSECINIFSFINIPYRMIRCLTILPTTQALSAGTIKLQIKFTSSIPLSLDLDYLFRLYFVYENTAPLNFYLETSIKDIFQHSISYSQELDPTIPETNQYGYDTFSNVKFVVQMKNLDYLYNYLFHHNDINNNSMSLKLNLIANNDGLRTPSDGNSNFITYYKCTYLDTNDSCSPESNEISILDFFAGYQYIEGKSSSKFRRTICNCHMYVGTSFVSPPPVNNHLTEFILSHKLNIGADLYSEGNSKFKYPQISSPADSNVSFSLTESKVVANLKHYHITLENIFPDKYQITDNFNSVVSFDGSVLSPHPSSEDYCYLTRINENIYEVVLRQITAKEELNSSVRKCSILVTSPASLYYPYTAQLTVSRGSFVSTMNIPSYTANPSNHILVSNFHTEKGTTFTINITPILFDLQVSLLISVNNEDFHIREGEIKFASVTCGYLQSNSSFTIESDSETKSIVTLQMSSTASVSYSDEDLLCEISFPFKISSNKGGKLHIPYSIQHNESLIKHATYTMNQSPFSYSISATTKPQYVNEVSDKKGITEVMIHLNISCLPTDVCYTHSTPYEVSVVFSNSFKGQSIISCTITSDSGYFVYLPITIANSHYVVQIPEFNLDDEFHRQYTLKCNIENSPKYVTSVNSIISLVNTNSLQSLTATAKSNYNQLSQHHVDSVALVLEDQAENVMVINPNTNIRVTRRVVTSVEWVDSDKTVNVKIGELKQLVFDAVKTIHPKIKKSDIVMVDLTVNGLSHIPTTGNETSPKNLLEFMDTLFLNTKQSQYSVSFGLNTGGNFNLDDVKNAIDTEISKNPDLNDVSTSTVLNDIISQCLAAGYGCGALCAPCTSNSACKNNFDCITGVCSFNVCQAYDSQEIPSDNHAVNSHVYFAILFVGFLCINMI